MTVLNKLASSLNRRDELPNQELAREIAHSQDKKAAPNKCVKIIVEKVHVRAELARFKIVTV